MTTATALAPPAREDDRDLTGAHVDRWLADESPGGLGDPEIWADEAAMGMIACGGAAPASWIGTVIRVIRCPGLNVPVVYKVISRRWSQANGGRPYLVLEWPD